MSTTKKVLYITYDGMTDPLGQSQVIPYLQILAKEGYAITLLSTEKKDRYEKSGKLIQDLLDASSIRWETIPFTTKPPFLSKLLDQRRLNKKAEALHVKEKFDFVHCRSYVPAASAVILKKKFGIPFLFDMRGFWVDERVDNGQWNLDKPIYKWLYKVYKKKEKSYLKEAEHIIVLTNKGKKELINVFNVPVDKISVIPCSADLGHFDFNRINEQDKIKLREELSIDGSTKLLTYLGSLGGWYLTDEMLDFFKVLQQRISDIVFLFVTLHHEEEVLQKVRAKGIDTSLIRVSPATRKEVPLFLAISDWNIFFIKDAYSKKASSPTKQGEIMAMGVPVICNDIGDTGEITEKSGAGMVIKDFTKAEYERVADSISLITGLDKQKIRESAFTYYDLRNAGAVYSSIYKVFSSLRTK